MGAHIVTLAGCTDAELAAEADRRTADKDQGRPTKRGAPDWDTLLDAVDLGIATAIKDRRNDDDFSHMVYEATMDAIFVDYWAWTSTRSWNR
jgi:hypothetical protein